MTRRTKLMIAWIVVMIGWLGALVMQYVYAFALHEYFFDNEIIHLAFMSFSTSMFILKLLDMIHTIKNNKVKSEE